MASITIRRLDDRVKARLRVRAAQNNRSMEEEARVLLTDALKDERKSVSGNLADKIRSLVEPFGGFELEIPPREPMNEPIKFE